MRIVFMGTPDFARVSLQKLVNSKHEVVAVVTVPDKPQGRGLKLRPSPVKQFARQIGLPILQPAKLKDTQFIEHLKQFAADVFVVVAFKILPPQVFNLPPKGTVNLHASLLPRYRGAAPINWAIINGETETGVTTMLINERVDEGNMLLQKEVAITPDMTAGELHDLLAEIGADLLLETLDRMEINDIQPVKQDEKLATKAPKITKEMCHLNFNQPAQQVHNWIRGLSPYPAAYCYWQGKQLKIFRSRLVSNLNDAVEPGTIVKVFKNGFTVKCASGAVDVFEVQIQGKKRMAVEDFLNGYNLAEGQLLK
ncbi:MAG: methionyl-tRNA formyltransferase [Caldisericaceae bacterium]|nr:methionyl-tRNA formyltransferase [Caldisericaceae bacterium]